MPAPYELFILTLHCLSYVGRPKTRDRDCNAARNILLIYMCKYKTGDVPWAFRRSTPQQPLPEACRRKYEYKITDYVYGALKRRAWTDGNAR